MTKRDWENEANALTNPDARLREQMLAENTAQTANEVRNPRHEWYVLDHNVTGRVQCRQCGVVSVFPGSNDECVWRPESLAVPATTDDAQRLEEIRQRLSKSTPGPWQTRFIYRMFQAARGADGLYQNTEKAQDWPDADFVANCANDVPWLLAIIDRQNAVVEAARVGYRYILHTAYKERIEKALHDLDTMSKTAPD